MSWVICPDPPALGHQRPKSGALTDSVFALNAQAELEPNMKVTWRLGETSWQLGGKGRPTWGQGAKLGAKLWAILLERLETNLGREAWCKADKGKIGEAGGNAGNSKAGEDVSNPLISR